MQFLGQWHFFRFAEQGGIDRSLAAVGAAVALVIDPVLAEFGLRQILGTAPVDLFQLALGVADIAGVK